MPKHDHVLDSGKPVTRAWRPIAGIRGKVLHFVVRSTNENARPIGASISSRTSAPAAEEEEQNDFGVAFTLGNLSNPEEAARL